MIKSQTEKKTCGKFDVFELDGLIEKHVSASFHLTSGYLPDIESPLKFWHIIYLAPASLSNIQFINLQQPLLTFISKPSFPKCLTKVVAQCS